jgi:hypothetical protein
MGIAVAAAQRTLYATIALSASILMLRRSPSGALRCISTIRTQLFSTIMLVMDALPTTYSEFSNYPIQLRKAFFQRLNPDVKAEFWRRHLSECLRRRADLTPRQIEIVNLTLNFVTPEWGHAEMSEFLGHCIIKFSAPCLSGRIIRNSERGMLIHPPPIS